MLYVHEQRFTKKRLTGKIAGTLTICLGIVLLLYAASYTSRDTVISPLPSEQSEISFFKRLFTKKGNPDDLRKKIQTAVGDTWRNYSVYVVNHNTGFTVGIGETVIYTAASVNKVPIIAALYYFAQNGEIDLDKTITIQEADIQDYGTGIIRYDKPGSSYSIKTLARLMMQKSDNTAAYILGNHIIGIAKIQALLNSWGLTQTDIVNNKTSNIDMELLFTKIIQGNIANPAMQKELLSFLMESDFENRLPALLPEGTKVYHKIGSEVGLIHDVGYVVTPKTSYYVGIFTSDVTDEVNAEKKIAELSKIVYDFLD